MIGSSRETVSRTLGHLADRGLIAVSRDGIHLTDRAALRAAARLS
jgi:CRP-like cAMP-binding protein